MATVSPPTVNSLVDRNEVFLVGSLVRDPEARYTGNGKLVCNFTLCVQRGQHREFINCTSWEALAEKVSALKNPPSRNKQRLKIAGRLATRSWERNGEKRFATEIVCQSVEAEGVAL